MTRRNLLHGLALACAVMFLAAPLRADDPPAFKKRGDMEKKFVSEVCVAILKAAHPTGVEPTLDRYEYKSEKEGRTTLTMKGTFKGKITKKVYTADIIVYIDSLKKDAWEVLKVEYSDNDAIPYNKGNIEELIKKFNR